MPAKIRLQRHGKKGNAFFHIVIADGRAPMNGRFIEKIGTYNPSTNPASIIIDGEKALQWLKNGAQPTETCRAILSYKGIIYKNHLAKGVAKGALTQEQADAKFEKWLSEKEGKVEKKKTTVASNIQDEAKKRLAAESASKEAKAAKIVAKNTPPAEEPAAAESAPEAPSTEEAASPEA